jgi:hypothetical protein
MEVTVINAPVGSSSNDTNSTGASKKLPTGAVVGVAVGAVALVFLIVLLLLWRRKEQRRKRFSEAIPVLFGVNNSPKMSKVKALGLAATVEGSSDSHRTFPRDAKVPLPIGDNVLNQGQQQQMGEQGGYHNEQRKPELPTSHEGYVSYSHPYGQAGQVYKIPQLMTQGTRDNADVVPPQQAPWFQQTEGSHPVEALQQHQEQELPSPPSPASPINPSSDQQHYGRSHTPSHGTSGGTSNEGHRIILD